MKKNLVFYDRYDHINNTSMNLKRILSNKQLIFLRWYMLAKMENLIDDDTDSSTDKTMDRIIMSGEYYEDQKKYLNFIRDKYQIQDLKQLVEDSIRSKRI
jgi:hypothetical protein